MAAQCAPRQRCPMGSSTSALTTAKTTSTRWTRRREPCRAVRIGNNVVRSRRRGLRHGLRRNGRPQGLLVNATTGAIVWTATTGAVVKSSPAVANGIVYIGSDDGKVYAFNATTGATVWTYTTGPAFIDNDTAVRSSPAVQWDRLHRLRRRQGLRVERDHGGKGLGLQHRRFCVVITGGCQWDRLRRQQLREHLCPARTDGLLLLQRSTGGSAGSPIVANGIVYDSDGFQVYAWCPGASVQTFKCENE